MISILITSFNEPETIGRAISAFESQNLKDYEIIISAPDEETLKIAKNYSLRNNRIRIFKDNGRGKPSAINMAFKKIKGKIVILTDGDVYVSKNSVRNLIKHFSNSNIGAVSGKVISTNSHENLFGFWAHVLTLAFHNLRSHRASKGKNIICSGYLYAIRKDLFKSIPENTLADDTYISLLINSRGYKTIYEPNSAVYVKYPSNLIDWIKQKKRTSGRLYQLKRKFNLSEISSFFEEVYSSITILKEIKRLRDIFYFIFLIVMKGYIWFRVFFDFRLWNRPFKKTWERIESTK